MSARKGAFAAFASTGTLAYFLYRNEIKKEFLRSQAHYRMDKNLKNITPWEANYFSWYRMPDLEWQSEHRFTPYYVVGQLDVSKEILIPHKKQGNDGFHIYSPLYCYETGNIDMERLAKGQSSFSVERAAIIVNRGWIPHRLKDKRKRPEKNSRQLTKVTGCWKKSMDIHDYKVPNNPNNNDWHNACVQDMATFWQLPNFNEFKFFYFEAVNLDGKGTVDPITGEQSKWPLQTRKDEFINEDYGWKVLEKELKYTWKTLGAFSAFSFACFSAWI